MKSEVAVEIGSFRFVLFCVDSLFFLFHFFHASFWLLRTSSNQICKFMHTFSALHSTTTGETNNQLCKQNHHSMCDNYLKCENCVNVIINASPVHITLLLQFFLSCSKIQMSISTINAIHMFIKSFIPSCIMNMRCIWIRNIRAHSHATDNKFLTI